MNRQECDVLYAILKEPFVNQRLVAASCSYSLGVVNRSIRNLMEEEYLNEMVQPTQKAYQLLHKNSPQNAIILAAGFGMRLMPISTEIPKAFLEINGERLIERIIKHLHEIGIMKIYVVVGFLKESFEYLIDDFGVELIVNKEYAMKNNLHSLMLALKYISNTYIIPSDIWCDENPFNRHELYSWYMVSDRVDDNSEVRLNRKMELVRTANEMGGNAMLGIAYISKQKAVAVQQRVKALSESLKYNTSFWEEALYEKDRMIIGGRIVRSTGTVEINTYEQLKEIDSNSDQLKLGAINVILEVLKTSTNEISNIVVLKKGMTNRSFLFTCNAKKYIMRIPGEGTARLINREQEAAVYKAISGKNICEDPIYINSSNGYKLTKYIENVRCCNPHDITDVKKCMQKLRTFHSLELQVKHEFELFKMIEFYELLRDSKPSIYRDYELTKRQIFSLENFINEHVQKKALTHIDAVPDNFLFSSEENSEIELQLTDWEYAGMQDPHIDIAMFCIYSLYNKQQIDETILLYFEGKCSKEIRLKIYCYVAACGLLWSNWCEYKRDLGVEFGEYSLRQYRYAKDYYKYFTYENGEEDRVK